MNSWARTSRHTPKTSGACSKKCCRLLGDYHPAQILRAMSQGQLPFAMTVQALASCDDVRRQVRLNEIENLFELLRFIHARPNVLLSGWPPVN